MVGAGVVIMGSESAGTPPPSSRVSSAWPFLRVCLLSSEWRSEGGREEWVEERENEREKE